MCNCFCESAAGVAILAAAGISFFRGGKKRSLSEQGGEISKIPTKDGVKKGGISHSQFILDNPGKILDFYNVDKQVLGEGSYGAVSKATNKKSKAPRACKTIPKAKMKDMERFKTEIAIMKMMDHPNIIKLYESFEDHRNVYLIMELSSGGELFDRIIECGHFTEMQAAILMQQMIKGINYMHSIHVAHRDLKPENFLFATKEPFEKSGNYLKIIDFGLSCKFEEGQVLTTKAGTPYYVSPQVLQGRYDKGCDLWSIGVIMYVMLCGYPPFFGDVDAEVLKKVRAGHFSFSPVADWKKVSQDAKNLIKELLKMKPEERYTAEQALQHPWIKEKAPQSKGVTLEANFVDKLRAFRSQNKLKKAALNVIASQLNDDQINNLTKIFMSLDANGDGVLTADEMRRGLKKSGLKDVPADLQQILEAVDGDGSGVIDYTEFLAATLEKRSYIKEDVCWAAFRIFDKNGDGKISMDELKSVVDDGDVQTMAGKENLAQMMKELDTNGDGEIDFKEFMAMMHGSGSKMS